MLLHDFVKNAVDAHFGKARGAHKEFAAKLHDALTTYESVGFDTVRTRVSKLLSGDPDGRAFFWADDQPHRVEVLARTVAADVQDLRTLAGQLVLVVDPRIDPGATDFLHGRLPYAREPFAFVVPEHSEDPRKAMRDEALRHSRALVLLAQRVDSPFFEGAGVDCSTFWRREHAWLIDSRKDLYALPLPALFDAEGRVCVPVVDHPSIDALPRINARQYGHDWAGTILRQLGNGNTPTLTLAQAVAWYSEARGRSVEVAQPCVHHVFTAATKPTVWEHNGKVFADARVADDFGSFLAPHHKVLPPPWTDALREVEFLWSDPWSVEATLDDVAHPIATALRDAIRESGPWTSSEHSPSLEDGWELLRKELRSKTAEAVAHLSAKADSYVAHFGAKSAFAATTSALADGKGPVRMANPEDFDAAMQRLQALASHGAEPTPYGIAVVRVLDLARTAPMSIVQPGQGQLPHLVFDLGAGHIVELRTAILAGEARPFEVQNIRSREPLWGTTTLWGGDVLLRLIMRRFQVLEGSSPASLAGKRRRKRDQEFSYDDDDD